MTVQENQSRKALPKAKTATSRRKFLKAGAIGTAAAAFSLKMPNTMSNA